MKFKPSWPTVGSKGYISPPYSPRCNPIENVFGMLKPLYRKNCPSVTSTNKEDYKQIFIDLVNQYKQSSFKSTFDDTLTFLRETRHNIDADPNFQFIGYDILTFIRLNTQMNETI
jgi:transposase